MLAAVVFLVAAQVPTPPPPLHLAELIEEARRNNPDLLATREQARAAALSVGPAGALDDPMLMVQLWNAPIDLSTVPLMVQLSQPLPLGGKRRAREALAAGEADMARANAAIRAAEIEAAVARAYFDLYLADRTLRAEAEIEATLRSLITAAASRIAAGRGEQSEALRAQAELLKIESDREAVTARRRAASARLVALLNRPPASEMGSPTEPGLASALPPEAELQRRALQARPERAGAGAAIAQASANERLAEAERTPDIRVFLGEMHQFRGVGVSDFVTAGFEGNLPVWGGGKTRPRIAAAAARVSAAQAEAAGLANRIAAEVADAYAEVTAEQRQVELHHQLIPVARQALASASASYGAGKGTFFMVLDSERDLLMHELDLANHLVMYEQRLAELERAVGGDVGLRRAAESGLRQEHRP